MIPRKMLLLIVAAFVGIGTVLAVNGLMAPPPAEGQAPVSSLEVGVAARDVPTGAILKDTDIKWVSWVQDADTSNLIVKGRNNPADYVGSIVRDGFRSGEPLIVSRLTSPQDHGFLAAVLTPGMRAMSIALSPTAEVAGFIFPGDRVDVILTHSFSRKDVSSLNERRISETILQNVRVLALDQRSDNQSSDPKIAQIATLEVSPKDAERLALAIDMTAIQAGRGSISLVLRSLAIDEKAPPTGKDPTWDSDVSSSYPSVDGEDSLLHRVQVMRGKAVSENFFERRR